MKNKLFLLTTLISCFLFSQQQNESIPLVYDTSGYLENNQVNNIVGTPPPPTSSTLTPTVNAEMNVNEVGGLTYMLPIELLKGVNNFQPNVALAYSSQSGNGHAGWGWNIVGLSMISRGGKSKEIDGITIGPQFDNNDPFYLDGQRFIKLNDTDYATEKFSKIKIQKQGSGDYSFIIKYTDGRIAKYKELVSGQHYISVIIDSFNNEIHYSYTTNNNTPSLDRISYGGADTTSDKFFVSFFYKNKLNALKVYRNGNEYVNSKVIDYITSSSSYTGTYRTYQLAYDYIENNSAERLRTITVSNESGEALKPLNFKYNAPTSTGQIISSSKAAAIIPAATTGLGNVALGDFYGTGEVEPVYQAKLKDKSFPTLSNKGTVTIPGLNSSSDYYSGKVLFNNKITKNDAIITTLITYPGDANANGALTDVVTFHMENLSTGEKREVQVNLPGGRLNVEPVYNSYDYTLTYPDKRDREGRTFQTGDFNNDGLFDVLILEKESIGRNANIYLLELGKTQAGTATPVILTNATILNNKKSIYPIDLDGDGLSEFFTTTAGNNNYSIYKLDLQNNNLITLTSQGSFANYSDDTPLFFGDFNGDGLTDFIYPQKVYKMDEGSGSLTDQFHQIENDQLYWWKYISNGKDFIKVQENYTPQKLAYIASTQKNIIKKYSFWDKLWSGKMDEYTHTEYSTNSIMVTDFNGDGRSDIIRVNKIGKIKYSTSGYIKDASVQNQDVVYTYTTNNNCHYSSNWPYIYGCDTTTGPSAIANKITFIPNISAKNGISTFAESNNQTVSIASKIISPFTLIYLSADANQLSSYKTNIVFRDVLSGTQDNYSIDNDGFLEKQIQEVDNGSGVIQKVEYRPMVANYSTSEVPYLYNREQANTFSYPLYIHSTNAGFYLAHISAKIPLSFDFLEKK